MIEEIQKILEYCCNEYDEKGRHIRNKCNSLDCEYYDETNGVCCSFGLKEARALYEAGYRKIPENAVVMTREEYEMQNYFSHRGEELLKQERKETAEKLLNKVDYESNGQTKAITDLLRKEYWVETK